MLNNVQMNAAGRMSDSKRNEGQLLCDILGLESLVDEITYKLASTAADEPTSTAILGPFYRQNAPKLPMGSCIVSKEINEQGDRTFMHGTVTDFKTGQPIEGAVVDVRGHLPEKEDEGDARNGLRAEDDSGEEGKDKEHGVSGCGGECGCVGGCSPARVLCGFLKTSAGCTETLAA